jgi:hypothetical protein
MSRDRLRHSYNDRLEAGIRKKLDFYTKLSKTQLNTGNAHGKNKVLLIIGAV